MHPDPEDGVPVTTKTEQFVSERFLTDFLDALEREDINASWLIGDLPIERDHHTEGPPAVEWGDFCELMRRLDNQIGGREGLEALGERMVQDASSRALASVVGLGASPRTLYRAAAGWLLHRALPGVQTRLVAIDGGHLQLNARLADGLAPNPQIFHVAVGICRSLPRLIGLRPAVVQASIGDFDAVYRIALPPSVTLLARVRRVFRTIFSAGTVLRYLEAQQLELHAKNAELERANTALAESERRYRAIADTAVDVLCEIDGDGRIAYVSASVDHLIGYSPEQVTGSHYHLWLPREWHARVDDAFEALLALPAGGTTQERLTLHGQGGARVVAELTARTYDDEAGARRMVLIARRVTNHASRRGEDDFAMALDDQLVEAGLEAAERADGRAGPVPPRKRRPREVV